MKTELLSANIPADCQRALKLLKSGELVAVPTETVYGLAADASNPEAVRKVFAAKNRPADHPLIVHIGDIAQLEDWAINIPAVAYDLAKAFWPGPLTLLLEKHPDVSPVVTGGLETIGIRIPNHPVLCDLLRENKLAIAAPSANPYQKLSPTSAKQVQSGLDGKIAAILDGGDCTVGTESTIIQINEQNAQVLRSGPLTAQELSAVTHFPIIMPESHEQKVSGNKDIHYQPNTRLLLKTTDELLSADDKKDIGYLVYSNKLIDKQHQHAKVIASDHAQYRHDLYASLYELDRSNLKEIWVEQPPAGEHWYDIHDRLQKAASKN